jgi:hypothetical protein
MIIATMAERIMGKYGRIPPEPGMERVSIMMLIGARSSLTMPKERTKATAT